MFIHCSQSLVFCIIASCIVTYGAATGVLQAHLFLVEEIFSGRKLILMDSLSSFIRATQTQVRVYTYHLYLSTAFKLQKVVHNFLIPEKHSHFSSQSF